MFYLETPLSKSNYDVVMFHTGRPHGWQTPQSCHDINGNKIGLNNEAKVAEHGRSRSKWSMLLKGGWCDARWSKKKPFMSLMQRLPSLVCTRYLKRSVWKCPDPAPYHLNVKRCTQRNIFHHFDKSSLNYSLMNEVDSEGFPTEWQSHSRRARARQQFEIIRGSVASQRQGFKYVSAPFGSNIYGS